MLKTSKINSLEFWKQANLIILHRLFGSYGNDHNLLPPASNILIIIILKNC